MVRLSDVALVAQGILQFKRRLIRPTIESMVADRGGWEIQAYLHELGLWLAGGVAGG